MASTSSFAPPKLADFILTERLGSGTYATVYKAYRKVSSWKDRGSCLDLTDSWTVDMFSTVTLQGNSREVVAVKVVGKKTLNKASTENLLKEIEILKAAHHPHIVQLKDFQVFTCKITHYIYIIFSYKIYRKIVCIINNGVVYIFVVGMLCLENKVHLLVQWIYFDF